MLRNFGRRAVMAVIALAVGSSSLAAYAAPPPPATAGVVILVVDTRRVMGDSKAGKAIQSQMQQQVSTYEKSISQQEQELMSTQQELQRQQTILAQDAFAAKAKEFDQRVAEARQKAQASRAELQQGQGQAENKVMGTVLQILSDIAKERNANFVLDKATVVLFDNSFDVTDEVIKRLDEKLPTMTVSFSPVAPGKAGSTPGGAAPASKAAPKKK